MACACVLNPKKPLQNKISDSSKVIKITKEDGEEAFRTLEKITQNNDYKYKTPMGLTAAIYKHRAKSPARKRVLEMIEAKPNQVDTSEAELTKLVEKRKDNDSRKRRERNAKSK
ncbi:MAG: hypothetical protein B9S32_12860 [Verrucomicrobia bacterium Tous-C9LFEB]|nr:MAG: hypothetical protein B9S32_12860 [Verrucomicrobia bacterium Tous-C9LFEB]